MRTKQHRTANAIKSLFDLEYWLSSELPSLIVFSKAYADSIKAVSPMWAHELGDLSKLLRSLADCIDEQRFRKDK